MKTSCFTGEFRFTVLDKDKNEKVKTEQRVGKIYPVALFLSNSLLLSCEGAVPIYRFGYLE